MVNALEGRTGSNVADIEISPLNFLKLDDNCNKASDLSSSSSIIADSFNPSVLGLLPDPNELPCPADDDKGC